MYSGTVFFETQCSIPKFPQYLVTKALTDQSTCAHN